MRDRLPGADALDEKSAALWLWDPEDLREILLFHPDLIIFDELADEDAADPHLRRVSAVAGQPIRGGRDLLLSTAGVPEGRGDASIRLVVTTTDHHQQELEELGLNSPCLKLEIYEPVRAPSPAPAGNRHSSSAITYAYVAGACVSAVGTVFKAFAKAFGGDPGAELLIYAQSPDSVRAWAHENGLQSAQGPVRIERLSSLASLGESAAWPFDVLIVDDAPGRLRPGIFEAALRGKKIVELSRGRQSDSLQHELSVFADTEFADPAGVDLSFGLAAEMLLAARRLAGGGSGVQLEDAAIARALAPDRLARRLGWITQASLGEIESESLSGVGWLTRWNVMCGIADHAAHQIAAAPGRHVVLAPKENSLLTEDASNVFRCWSNGLSGNGLEEAAAVIYQERLASVLIHFNWAFYHPAELLQFVRSVKAGGRVVQMDVHSTRSEGAPHGQRLEHFAEAFTHCDRVLVHQHADAERVRSVAPKARVAIEPLGITLRNAARADVTPAEAPLIACFGFCLPNKGIEELVLAIWMLRQSQENVRLLLLNAEHPAPQSRQMVDQVRQLIARLDLSDAVTFVTDYLDEERCLDMLSEASLIVNPYQQTGESASAAVRFALASTTPVLVTPLPIFDDLGGAVFRAGGISPAELAKSIGATLAELQAESIASAEVGKAAEAWREAHDLRLQTARIFGVAESIRRNRRADEWLRVAAC